MFFPCSYSFLYEKPQNPGPSHMVWTPSCLLCSPAPQHTHTLIHNTHKTHRLIHTLIHTHTTHTVKHAHTHDTHNTHRDYTHTHIHTHIHTHNTHSRTRTSSYMHTHTTRTLKHTLTHTCCPNALPCILEPTLISLSPLLLPPSKSQGHSDDLTAQCNFLFKKCL